MAALLVLVAGVLAVVFAVAPVDEATISLADIGIFESSSTEVWAPLQIEVSLTPAALLMGPAIAGIAGFLRIRRTDREQR
ncbi:MAG: hypothetical protein EXQ91_05500 [Alphaproteobacteria bacterium]|nr:hypothetical protein [Alphaproteobacteria bacterium]